MLYEMVVSCTSIFPPCTDVPPHPSMMVTLRTIILPELIITHIDMHPEMTFSNEQLVHGDTKRSGT